MSMEIFNFSSVRNNTQTAVTNMAIKRILKNTVHLLDVSYVSSK